MRLLKGRYEKLALAVLIAVVSVLALVPMLRANASSSTCGVACGYGYGYGYYGYVYVSWSDYCFDAKRGTEVFLNVDAKLFRFKGPGFDTGVVQDPDMQILPGQQVNIRYDDGLIAVRAVVSLGTGGYCFVSLVDSDTSTLYHLWARRAPAPTPTCPPRRTPVPTVTPTATPSATPSATPTVSPTPSPTPSATPTVSPTPTATPSATPTVSPSPTPSPTPVWDRICVDTRRGTELRVNTAAKYFQFLAFGYDSGVVDDPGMTILAGQQILIRYQDADIQLRASVSLSTGGFCFASLLDMQTKVLYHLWGTAGGPF